jgi:ABC-type branched-subunit amino acid transport system permease subunit
VVYIPVFMMKVLCFALFACAFNLLIGYGGLLSFGHAMFLGTAGYAPAHAPRCGADARAGHPVRHRWRRALGLVAGCWRSAARASTSR